MKITCSAISSRKTEVTFVSCFIKTTLLSHQDVKIGIATPMSLAVSKHMLYLHVEGFHFLSNFVYSELVFK